jgi:hypothetical protein
MLVQATPVTTIIPVITTGWNRNLVGGGNQTKVATITLKAIQAGVGRTKGGYELFFRLEKVVCCYLTEDFLFQIGT